MGRVRRFQTVPRYTTLRRRSQKLLHQIGSAPASAWRRIELERVQRRYRTPRILDQRVQLPGYEGPIRQLVVADLGHEAPTVPLTNQLGRKRLRFVLG
ncbi:MAG TPA: hypothetical protein EYH34_16255 [Planctomycetes bacterium]|nr:hypothetical protein [Planctomycetota bacterium]